MTGPITLLTDFGLSDTYVAQMKGVIAEIAPDARVIDLTHDVPVGNVLAGALLLDSVVDAMPDRAIHLAVVDPGVGSERASLAIQTERFKLVGPDNGLFTLVLRHYLQSAAVQLTNPAYQRPTVSPTFHGRDIFAPAAAHLWTGRALTELGQPVTTLTQLQIPMIQTTGHRLEAVVLLIDHFGNLVTNLTRSEFEAWPINARRAPVQLDVAGQVIDGIKCTYAEAKPNELMAYFGSSGRLEIAVRDGSAAKTLGVTQDTAARVTLLAGS